MAKNTAKKAVKKLQKKIGPVGIALVIIALVVGIGVGVFLSYIQTGEDDFYLLGDKNLEVMAGETIDYSTLKGDFYAVHMGKDVKNTIQVTPSFEVGVDGYVVLEEGTYCISYTMPSLFGTQEVVLYRTITVVSENAGGDSNG